MEVNLKTRYLVILLSAASALLLYGCSVKKNTGLNRAYHSVTTRYNVYFNANESFKRGYDRVEEDYAPNYSQIIDVYPSGKSGVAKSDMGRAVTKCEKALKEHSIKKKPKKNMNKTRDPEYMAFYNKEEFNTMIDDVWMLMGRAKFYSGDYLAASSIFTYVMKHFSEDPALCAKAAIWKARSFKEMDWLYEADEILSNLSDEHFTPEINCLYSGAYADLKIKQYELKEALPFLETAISLEKDKMQKRRFLFAAGQICQELGEDQKAFMLYEELISTNPPYEMAFNAKIRQTEVYGGQDREKIVKSLHRMAKNDKNTDYQDQVYYAIGNIYLADKDTVNAVENYKLSAEKSTRHGKEKAQSLIRLGGLYYEKGDYFNAQPCYSEAATIIDHEHRDYEKISNLAAILDELAKDNETVTLQDSLQKLAAMPKEERVAVIKSVIKKIEEEEKAERERQEQEWLRNQQLDMEIENVAIMDRRALGGNQRAEWYFYNKSAVEKGKLEFQRKYGVRKLEDNWNRKNKTIIFSDELAENEDADEDMLDDSARAERALANAENNPKSVEYYLRQIPFTEEQKIRSDVMIADALFNMGVVYNEKLADYPKAEATFNEFARRFPKDKRVADGYFYCYQMFKKQKDEGTADSYARKLVAECPESNYAKILSQPDYRLKLERMQTEQDSIYAATYKEFVAGNFKNVIDNVDYVEREYPVSPLVPKFLLLKSLSVGKMGERDSLKSSLNDLLVRYPESDVASMAKDVLALMNQGQTPMAGSAAGLMSMRDEQIVGRAEIDEDALARGFRVSDDSPCLFCIVTNPDDVQENVLLYETATYNFTKFLVKDFDLRVKNGMLTVAGLENIEEAQWYADGYVKDEGIKKMLNGKEYKCFVISEENSDLIGRGFTLEDYECFYRDSIASRRKSKNNGFKVELVGDEKAVEEITKEAKLDIEEGEDLMKAKVAAPVEKKTETEAPAAQKPEGNVPEVKQDSALTSVVKTPVLDQKQVVAPEKPAPPAEKPKKELKKYKGLYTYDKDASHKFVILVNGGPFDFGKAKTAIDKHNASQPLLNLSVSQASVKGAKAAVVVGSLPSADVAKSYLMQFVKNAEIKNALKGVSYRNIVISDDNLKVLQETGNINVYMELLKKMYLGR